MQYARACLVRDNNYPLLLAGKYQVFACNGPLEARCALFVVQVNSVVSEGENTFGKAASKVAQGGIRHPDEALVKLAPN
jgi:hypothetical protein